MSAEKEEPRREHAEYSNTSFALDLISGNDKTRFEFSCEPRKFDSELNRLMMVLPSLRDRLEPQPNIEGLERVSKVDYSYATGSPPTYQCALTDVLILADTTAGAFQIMLPMANNLGKVVEIVKVSSDGNAVTVLPYGTDLIEGNASFSLTAQWKKIRVVADGVGNWIHELPSEAV